MDLEICGEAAQLKLGARLAGVCPASLVVFLEGDLGTGKTTLVRGFLRGWGHQGPVRSPTYTLLEPYAAGGKRCYHLDLYRLADPGELEYLGVCDLLAEQAVIMIEWPERGKTGLPPADLVVAIRYAGLCRAVELRAESDKGMELLRDFGKIAD